jgi:HK97 family phage portal protein
MRLFGFEVAIRKAAVPQNLTSVYGQQGWTSIWGPQPEYAFQQDIHINHNRVQANWCVFACQTLIAGDIGKLGIRLMEWSDRMQIFEEVESPAVSPVFLRPNDYQTWPKFMQQWILSKVGHGNAYMLKERDARNVVTSLYVLDPHCVTPLVAPDGSVYYRLSYNTLAGVPEGQVTVPASEIMHDRMWCLYHPLVGLSPLFASSLAATQGLEIQSNSARFFANMSRPSGILTAPGRILENTQKEIKTYWETNFAGINRGRVAVLGDGLKYEALSINAVDSELVAQLKLTAEMICSTYHVPAYKVGVGPIPPQASAEVLNQIYYDDCIQVLIQDAETLLDEGLDLEQKGFNAQFNIDDLLRMDTATQIATLNESVKGGWLKPNEARSKRNLAPVDGGNSPYLQQQNFSLAALAKRDALPNPFVIDRPTANPTPSDTGPAPTADRQAQDAAAKALAREVIAKAAASLYLEDGR